jgi:Protein of unknown function (DUF1779).
MRGEKNMLKGFLLKMALAVGFLALFSLKYVDVSTGERQDAYPLESGWQVVGVPLAEVSTESWMQLNTHWMSVYELRELTNELQNKLGIIPHVKSTCGEQDGMTYASFEGKIGDGTIITITIQSMNTEKTIETQMGINTSHSGAIKNLGGYVANLEKRIAGIANDPHFKVMLLGEYQGKLEPNLIKEFSGRVFRKMKAEFISWAYEAGNSTQKGFTDLIPDSATYDSKRFNVEIGTRYDQERNTTQIILASPCLIDGV